MPDNKPSKEMQKALTRRFWQSALAFWSGDQRRIAWLMSATLVLLVIGQIAIAYRINVWNRQIFDAMEKKDGAAVLYQSAVFVPLAAVSITIAVLVVWARLRTQRRWRAWFTEYVGDRWLGDGRYYQLNFIKGEHQNPEHRLTEDMRIATEAPVDLAVGILTAFLTSVTFIGVLWTVGGSLPLTFIGSELVIPGYLVVAVVLYAIVISSSMLLIARSFVPMAEAKNQSEAEFRYALTRLRENGESIAILGGEKEERAGLALILNKLIGSYARLAGQYMRTMFVSHGNYIIASVIPVILCAPKFLAGTMSLGEVMQATAAFIQVQYAFNWIVDNYPRLAEFAASARRVAGLIVSTRPARPVGRGVDQARRGGRRGDPAEGCLGGAQRRHGGDRGRRDRHSARREGAARGRFRERARARWCAPSQGSGPGERARFRSNPAPSCS